jgi:hypothetical protein
LPSSRRDVPFGNGFAEPPERLYKIVRVAEKGRIKSLSEKLVLSDFKPQMNTDEHRYFFSSRPWLGFFRSVLNPDLVKEVRGR